MADISVPRVCDSVLLRIFIDETLFNKDKFNLSAQAYVGFNVGANSFRVSIDNNNFDEFVNILRNEHSYGSKIHAISIVDKGTNANCVYSYTRSSTGFVDLFKTPTQPVDEVSLQLGAHINDLILANTKHIDVGDPAITSVHNDVLSRLEVLSSELIKKQYDQVQKLEQDKQTFIDERTAEFTNKLSAQDKAYEAKLEDLEEKYLKRNDELDERQKQIDDADNTTARRKTTTKTLEEAQEKAKSFNFSDNVDQRSNKASLLAMILVAIGLFGLVFSAIELVRMQDTLIKNMPINSVTDSTSVSLDYQVSQITVQYLYFLYFRILASSALLVSSIVYLIRWYNSWANRIAQQELDNQMFIRDLNRAQLAVEMSLEWNEKKDGAIPSRLLESLTEGLFKPKDTAPQELLHPAEQIATALLKTSEKVTLPFHGGTLETTGRAIRRARTPRPKKEHKINVSSPILGAFF